jgi:hypothetical protein
MGILELTPSIRADTEAFEKALKELGWSKDQYHRKIKRAGLSLADKTSTKNFLNHHLKKIGSSFQYKNILQAPTKIATETGMGGVEPGKAGAPANEKIWRDGAKIQKVAEKKFKNLTDQRKYFVETMKKLYKNVPKSKILHIFKNILRGVKSFSPIGLSTELMMQMMEKNPELLNILNNKIDPSQVPMARKGGMMDINEMTRPLGYANGGFEDRMSMLRESMMDTENQKMREPDITSVAMTIAQQEGDTSEENINLIIRQLEALMPSLTKTMEKELTPLSTQGLKYLFDKMNIATGRKSDPRLNRSVGFGRVE